MTLRRAGSCSRAAGRAGYFWQGQVSVPIPAQEPGLGTGCSSIPSRIPAGREGTAPGWTRGSSGWTSARISPWKRNEGEKALSSGIHSSDRVSSMHVLTTHNHLQTFNFWHYLREIALLAIPPSPGMSPPRSEMLLQYLEVQGCALPFFHLFFIYNLRSRIRFASSSCAQICVTNARMCFQYRLWLCSNTL